MRNPFKKICAGCRFWEKDPAMAEVFCDTTGACSLPTEGGRPRRWGCVTEASDGCAEFAPRHRAAASDVGRHLPESVWAQVS